MQQIDREPDAEDTNQSARRDVECIAAARKTTLFSLLEKAHAMAILHEFAVEPDPWRFNELKDRLDLSPNTLSERLGELVEAELITRQSYDEIPPRVEYEATAKAQELEPMYRYLSEWAERHDH
jgi:DNA-binding HxlR family transcriptional regulator